MTKVDVLSTLSAAAVRGLEAVAQPTGSGGAKKYDQGKLPVMRGVFLRFPRAMYEIARVSMTGTTKYDVPITDMEFVNVPDGFGRYTDALGRHLLDEAIHGPKNVEKGGNLPPEGHELLHAAQAAWDALARLEIMLIAKEKGAAANGGPPAP